MKYLILLCSFLISFSSFAAGNCAKETYIAKLDFNVDQDLPMNTEDISDVNWELYEHKKSINVRLPFVICTSDYAQEKTNILRFIIVDDKKFELHFYLNSGNTSEQRYLSVDFSARDDMQHFPGPTVSFPNIQGVSLPAFKLYHQVVFNDKAYHADVTISNFHKVK